MKKLFSIVLTVLLFISIPLSSVMASQYSQEDYEKAFNMLESIRKKKDDFEKYLRDEFVRERFESMVYEYGHDNFVLRYQDIPEKDREVFEYTYAYMKTTHVTKTTHPDNWIDVYKRNEYKVVPYQIVELSRSMIWLEQMGDIVSVLQHYRFNKDSLPSKMEKSYEEFLSEIPMYMESLDTIINYTEWVLAKPESELNSLYENVEGYPYDWFQHSIFKRLKREAEILKSLLTPLSMTMGNSSQVVGSGTVKTDSKKTNNDFGGIAGLGLLLGLTGGLGVSGYRRMKGEFNPFWHFRNTVLVNKETIKGLSKHQLFADYIKRILYKFNIKNSQEVVKSAISGIKKIVPVLRAAPFIKYFFDMKDAIGNPNKTEADIRYIGEKTTSFIINGVFMIGGAMLGAEFGVTVGLAVGSPTGPGAVATALGGAFSGGLAGSIAGDYIGGWVSDKIAHFGGDIAMNVYEYSKSHDNIVANFLKKIF